MIHIHNWLMEDEGHMLTRTCLICGKYQGFNGSFNDYMTRWFRRFKTIGYRKVEK
jgi:hypothetical protein